MFFLLNFQKELDIVKVDGMKAYKLLKAGIAASKAGDNTTASAIFSRVVQNNPRSVDGWFWLGVVMPTDKQKIDCFRRVIKFEPDHFEALGQLRELGYLKPSEPKKEPVSAFSFDDSDERPSVFNQELPSAPIIETTPLSSASPFAAEEKEKSFDGYYEELSAEPERETLPAEEKLDFMENVDSEKKGKSISEKTKGRKIWLIVMSVLAFFSVAGVAFVFISQPTLINDIASAIIPPTATPFPLPTATATAVPMPTALPFSALEMGEYVPVFEPSGCDFRIPTGQRVDCGFVILPEDRYGDISKTIRLAVAVYRGADSSATPIIYLEGGPGRATLELLSENFALTIAPYVGERDFILLDQRGVGLSEPNLSCPKLDEIYKESLLKKTPLREKEKLYLNALGECRDRLATDGVNLSSYNTMESAADIRDIVLALGYEKATLFGISYGTRLAQVVMRESPEIVYSAVLDSLVPIEAQIYSESEIVAQTALETLFAGCAASAKCQDAYPTLERDLRKVIGQLEIKPLHTNIFGSDRANYSHSIDGSEFMSIILWTMRDSASLELIPQTIGRVEAGETNMLGVIASAPMEEISDISLGAYLSISCREQVYLSSRQEMSSSDLASYPDTDDVGLSWIYAAPNFIFDLCDIWGVDKIRPEENDALVSDIPTLLMAGEYDATTPPFWTEQVSARLSRATYLKFLGQGHKVSYSQNSLCPQNILKNFFNNPENPLDTSCIAGMLSPQFSTPYVGEPQLIMIPFVSRTDAIITTIPAGWTALEGAPAAFSREVSSWDKTSISVEKVGLGFDTIMGTLLNDYKGIGLDSYPTEVGEITTENLSWKLYKSTQNASPVDIALAQDGFNTVVVVFSSHTDEHDILYEEVFLEVLNKTDRKSVV